MRYIFFSIFYFFPKYCWIFFRDNKTSWIFFLWYFHWYQNLLSFCHLQFTKANSYSKQLTFVLLLILFSSGLLLWHEHWSIEILLRVIDVNAGLLADSAIMKCPALNPKAFYHTTKVTSELSWNYTPQALRSIHSLAEKTLSSESIIWCWSEEFCLFVNSVVCHGKQLGHCLV